MLLAFSLLLMSGCKPAQDQSAPAVVAAPRFSSAPVPAAFLGVKLRAPLADSQIAECRKREDLSQGFKRAVIPGPLCIWTTRAMPDYVEAYNLPELPFAYNLYVVKSGDVVEGLFLTIAGTDYAAASSLLHTQFGEPTRVEKSTYRNGNASRQGVTSRWLWNGVTVALSEVEGRFDMASIRVSSKAPPKD